MSLDHVEKELKQRGFNVDQAFFDVISLIVNAGAAVHPHIADRVQHLSTESKYFDFHFRDLPYAKMHQPEFDVVDFFRPS